LLDGHAAGSISMASYTVGLDCPTAGDLDDQPAAPLPTGVPADEANSDAAAAPAGARCPAEGPAGNALVEAFLGVAQHRLQAPRRSSRLSLSSLRPVRAAGRP
jgi:hypothetical protein